MSGAVQLFGFEGLDAKLARLPIAVAGTLLAEACHAGMRVVTEDAKRRVAVASGETRDAITQRKTRGTGTGVTISTGVFKRGLSSRARWLEQGVRPHTITGKLLADAGGTIFGRKVAHPGVPAKPFLRPALDSKGSEAVRVMGQTLGKAIEEEAATGRVAHRVAKRQLTRMVRSTIRASQRARGALPARTAGRPPSTRRSRFG